MDEYGVENIDKLEFGKDVEQLSLWSNRIANYDNLVVKLKTLPNLKAVWLNGNPVADSPDFFAKLFSDLPHLQLINKQLTPSATEWVFKVIAQDKFPASLEDTLSLDLSGRKIENLAPELLEKLPRLRELDLSGNAHLVSSIYLRPGMSRT